MNYGLPYQGSKNKIAKDIINVLPSGERFVDLFAGGCAITHAALLSGKYDRFMVNDKYPVGTMLFKQALAGEFNKPEYMRWVSREEFFAKKDTDPFVNIVFSFGNGGQTYMYSKQIEPLKKGLHYAVVYDDWSYLEEHARQNNWKEGLLDELKKSVEGIENIDQRRLNLTKPAYDNQVINLPHNMVQNLERMNRLQSITNPNNNIDFTSMDYREYVHQDGDIVYCDPPYKGTKGYNDRNFDHDSFYDWARTRDYPIYFSEYSSPDDFVSIWQKAIPKHGAGGKSAHNKAIEKVFVHQKFAAKKI